MKNIYKIKAVNWGAIKYTIVSNDSLELGVGHSFKTLEEAEAFISSRTK